MTNQSYATVARQLGERAAQPGSFEPWLFFPREWDWPWLSFEEASGCVEAWTRRLDELAGGRALAVNSALNAPETLLLRIAIAASNLAKWVGTGGEERLADAATESAGLSFQSSPIRPKLQLEIEYGRIEGATGELTDSPEAVAPLDPQDREPLRIDRPRSRRSVVLTSGVLPSAELLGAVLDADAALILEPVKSALVGALRLRPDVLYLQGGESGPVLDALQEPSRKTTRAQKQLRSAVLAVVQVIVEGPEDLRLFARKGLRYGWNPRVVSCVPR